MNKKPGLVQKLLLCGFLTFISTEVQAHSCPLGEITPDSTLGSEASKITPNAIIKGANADLINGGAQRGNNLFHSFTEFNIQEAQGVYFANPSGVVNILTRVTGGNASNILGTLGVDGAANLFLINPNGILFGQNARLDIGGSFVGTTANGVQFGNQGNFSATNPEVLGLLTINPSALFFNQINPNTAIQNNSVAPVGVDPAGFNANGLRVPNGKSLLLVGSNVIIDGGELNAYGGRVELGGLASPGEISLQTDDNNLKLGFPENVARADVSLNNRARVYVEASERGNITFNARNIDISGGSLLSAGIGKGLGSVDSQAGDITLNATGKINIAQSSRIENNVNTNATGNAGNINIIANSLSLTDNSELSTSTFGKGSAGNLIVSAKDFISLADKSTIFSSVDLGAKGQGGNIDINAGSLSILTGGQLIAGIYGASENQKAGQGNSGNINIKVSDAVVIDGKKDELASAIFNNTENGTIGNGGDITIDANSLSLTNGARINASTSGLGKAGNITVTAKDSIYLADKSRIVSSVNSGAEGTGGNIDINAGSLYILEGAQLIAGIYGASEDQKAGQGSSGNITIKVDDAVIIDGKKDGLASAIFNDTGNKTIGNGGNITIDSNSLYLANGAQINASTSGLGNAGNVIVSAKDSILLTDKSKIVSSVNSEAEGTGGNIDINTGSLYILEGAQLIAGIYGASEDRKAGQGSSGNINVKVDDAVLIDGKKDGLASAIFNDTEKETIGNGGDITIESNSLYLANGARINASTSGLGNAGNITVRAKDSVSLTDANIFSTVEVGGIGRGGDITINSGSFFLSDGAQLSASMRGEGKAGNVNINALGSVSLTDANILSNIEAGGIGQGGNININAASLSIKDTAQLQTALMEASDGKVGGRGNAGSVNIDVKGAVTIAGSIGDSRSAIYSEAKTGTVGNGGNGGNIAINSDSFALNEGTTLETSTRGQGSAGNLTLRAKDSILITGSYILNTVEAGGVGKGGNIDINATKLSILDGAQVQTLVREAVEGKPAGRGDAGNININITDAVNISGKKNGINSAIVSYVGTGTIGNAGNITINSGFFSLSDKAIINTSTGRTGNAGNVSVSANNFVSLVDGDILSTVRAGGVGRGGNIDIKGASLSLLDGSVLRTSVSEASDTQAAGRGNAGNIDINVTGAVKIAGAKNQLSGIASQVDTGTTGNGGSINITSESFTLNNGFLLASTFGKGDAGNISVNVNDFVSLARASILSTVEESAVGKGGNIDINAFSLTMSEAAKISTSLSGGQGQAGNIAVRAKGPVALTDKNTRMASTVEPGTIGNGGKIDIKASSLSLEKGSELITLVRSSDASELSAVGNAGDVNINVTGAVNIFGGDNDFLTWISSRVEPGTIGNAGNISISSDSFLLTDGAQLSSSTFRQGSAGKIKIQANNSVSIIGSNIFSTVQSGGIGNGGNVDINATSLSLLEGGQLLTFVSEASENRLPGQGSAGNVNIKVKDKVTIAGNNKYKLPSVIGSSIGLDAVGNGGDVNISSASISLANGGIINTGTFGDGNAGAININSTDVNISGVNFTSRYSSGLLTETFFNGRGGDITITSSNFKIADGAVLNARTIGDGDAGNITVNTNSFEALNGGQLATTTSSSGSAGKITINSTDRVFISGSDTTYNSRVAAFPLFIRNVSPDSGLFVFSEGSSVAGNIKVTSPKVTLDNRGKLIAESASGNGGNVNLNSDLLLLRRGAQISTNAGTEQLGGDGGNIDINSRFIVAVPSENSDITANAFIGTGGNVNIRTQSILGIEPRTFESPLTSDITASSKSGIQGQIAITEPDVQPAQGLVELPEEVVDATRRVAQICPREPGAKPLGEFTITGRGSLPPSPLEPLPGTTNTTKLATLNNSNTNVSNIASSKVQNTIVEAQGWVKNKDGSLELVAMAPQTTLLSRAVTSACPF